LQAEEAPDAYARGGHGSHGLASCGALPLIVAFFEPLCLIPISRPRFGHKMTDVTVITTEASLTAEWKYITYYFDGKRACAASVRNLAY